MTMMDRMRAQMQAHRAPQTSHSQAISGISELNPAPADDSPLPEASTSTTQVPMSAIDPSLLCSNPALANGSPVLVVPGPSTQASVISPFSDVTRIAQLSSVSSGPTTTPGLITPTNRVPPTPHSPLTDEDELLQLPLTPVTNKWTTTSKAKGKKRVCVPDEGEERSEGSHAKRPRRNRK